jgi:hypothetical protein
MRLESKGGEPRLVESGAVPSPVAAPFYFVAARFSRARISNRRKCRAWAAFRNVDGPSRNKFTVNRPASLARRHGELFYLEKVREWP